MKNCQEAENSCISGDAWNPINVMVLIKFWFSARSLCVFQRCAAKKYRIRVQFNFFCWGHPYYTVPFLQSSKDFKTMQKFSTETWSRKTFKERVFNLKIVHTCLAQSIHWFEEGEKHAYGGAKIILHCTGLGYQN